MAEPHPLWRRAIDAADTSVSPRLEELVRSEQFADTAAVVARLQGQLQRRTERVLRRGWHFWNLPAGSDVKRMSEQIASLERRVRDLSKQLEEVQDKPSHKPSQGGNRGQSR